MATAAPQSEQSIAPPISCRSLPRLRWTHWLIMGLVAATAVVLLYLLPSRQWLRSLITWTGDAGIWGVLAFIVLYSILATLALPVTPLNLAAGLLFGVWTGFIAALTGGVGAAALSCLVSRHLFRERFKRRLACQPRFEALVEGIEEEQWKMVILTRLNPILPASLKNYSFGMTHVSWPVYIVGTTLALIPATFLLAYLGSAGHLNPDGRGEWGTLDIVLYGIGGVLAAIATFALAHVGRRKMAELEARHAERHRHGPGA